MAAVAPDRHATISKTIERLEAGETVDPKTNYPLKLDDEEDRPVPLEPGDLFWIWIANEMAGALAPEATYPTPSEEDHVLDRLCILHPDNRRFVREHLRFYWKGRSEGLATKHEKPKVNKPSPFTQPRVFKPNRNRR